MVLYGVRAFLGAVGRYLNRTAVRATTKVQQDGRHTGVFLYHLCNAVASLVIGLWGIILGVIYQDVECGGGLVPTFFTVMGSLALAGVLLALVTGVVGSQHTIDSTGVSKLNFIVSSLASVALMVCQGVYGVTCLVMFLCGCVWVWGGDGANSECRTDNAAMYNNGTAYIAAMIFACAAQGLVLPVYVAIYFAQTIREAIGVIKGAKARVLDGIDESENLVDAAGVGFGADIEKASGNGGSTPLSHKETPRSDGPLLPSPLSQRIAEAGSPHLTPGGEGVSKSPNGERSDQWSPFSLRQIAKNLDTPSRDAARLSQASSTGVPLGSPSGYHTPGRSGGQRTPEQAQGQHNARNVQRGGSGRLPPLQGSLPNGATT